MAVSGGKFVFHFSKELSMLLMSFLKCCFDSQKLNVETDHHMHVLKFHEHNIFSKF